MTIEAEIARIKGLAEKATKGPWANDDPSWKELNDITVWAPGGKQSVANMGGSFACCDDKDEAQQNFDNGAFVADARTSVPRLCDALAEAMDYIPKDPLLNYGVRDRIEAILKGETL